MKNYIQPGNALDLAVPYDVTSGAPFKVGAIIAIAAAAATNGSTVAGFVEGVYDVTTSDTAAAWSVGDTIYFDATNKVFTKTATSNTKAGYAVLAKGSSAATGRIRLVPSI